MPAPPDFCFILEAARRRISSRRAWPCRSRLAARAPGPDSVPPCLVLLHINVNQAILNLRDQSALRMSACESSAHRAFNFQHPCGGACSRLGGLWLIRERNCSSPTRKVIEVMPGPCKARDLVIFSRARAVEPLHNALIVDPTVGNVGNATWIEPVDDSELRIFPRASMWIVGVRKLIPATASLVIGIGGTAMSHAADLGKTAPSPSWNTPASSGPSHIRRVPRPCPKTISGRRS
jgi:hypothetical protein